MFQIAPGASLRCRELCWGDPSNKNAQYVIQPYYVAANNFQFMTPPDRLTHSFRWQPGRVTFKTARETAAGTVSSVVAENVFTSGVPVPGGESLHVILYVEKGTVPPQHETEVVIEKFEYLP